MDFIIDGWMNGLVDRGWLHNGWVDELPDRLINR